jgi:sporulation protein YlmC with PRC-barrel domain
MHLKLSELKGRPVLDANGRVIGKIKAPLVELETWLVDALRVTLRRAVARDMAIAWSFWRRATMDIPTGQIHAAGDAIILRIAVAELREATPEALPDAAFASIH